MEVKHRKTLSTPASRVLGINGHKAAHGTLTMKECETNKKDDNVRISAPQQTSSWKGMASGAVLFAFLLFTIVSFPREESNASTIFRVFWYAWMTAMSTGLGAVPFIIVKKLNDRWLGLSNAMAAGMMLSASGSLVFEGCSLKPLNAAFTEAQLVGIGVLSGFVFIILTKKVLDDYEDVSFGALDGLDAKKALLIMAVMTCHSFAEGVGIGVSFGSTSDHLGLFVSASLAIHNIPEGVAICLVLIPRGLSVAQGSLWAIMSSSPQPVMAVVAFWFVDKFIPILPIGLGFAAGAMTYVALFELAHEASEQIDTFQTILVISMSAYAMVLMQDIVKEAT